MGCPNLFRFTTGGESLLDPRGVISFSRSPRASEPPTGGESLLDPRGVMSFSRSPRAFEPQPRPQGRSCRTHTDHSLKRRKHSLSPRRVPDRNARLKPTPLPPVSFTTLVPH